MVRYALFPLALVAAAPAMAAPRDDVYSASLRCAAITDDRTWLDCYYGAAQPMRGQLQLPPAPAAQTALVPALVPGAPVLAMRPAQPAAARPAAPGYVGRTMELLTGGDALVSKVAIKSYTGGGSFHVVLANGQEWIQIDGQPRFIRWRNGPPGHTATIWKGAMNTFNLGFDAEADRYKVRRVK